jgi:hypothetical protein
VASARRISEHVSRAFILVAVVIVLGMERFIVIEGRRSVVPKRSIRH